MQDQVEQLAWTLAQRRLEVDFHIAREAGCPSLLKLGAYLDQARRDASQVLQHWKTLGAQLQA